MSPDSYAVGAPVLLNAYWHIHVAELILAGAEPREANEAAWKSYYFGTLTDYARNESPPSADLSPMVESLRRAAYPGGDPRLSEPQTAVPSEGPHKHWTTRCLVAALADDERLLATSWDDLTRQYPHKHGRCARAPISAEHARNLQWQCHMMWLLATGAGDLLRCARIANDRAAGKPARKRKPADPAWLAAELDAALGAAWDALRNADDGTGRPFWKIRPDPVRPRAEGETLRHGEAMANVFAILQG
jgi:hypothetical protein